MDELCKGLFKFMNLTKGHLSGTRCNSVDEFRQGPRQDHGPYQGGLEPHALLPDHSVYELCKGLFKLMNLTKVHLSVTRCNYVDEFGKGLAKLTGRTKADLCFPPCTQINSVDGLG